METGRVTQRRLPALYRHSWDNLLSRIKSTDGGELSQSGRAQDRLDQI